MNKHEKAVKDLREVLEKAYRRSYAAELWDIMTALRGPDSGDDNLKREYTQHIRALVVSENVQKDINCLPDHIFGYYKSKLPFTGKEISNILNEKSYRDGHFLSHIRRVAMNLEKTS